MELVNTIKSLTDRYGVSGDEFGVSAQAVAHSETAMLIANSAERSRFFKLILCYSLRRMDLPGKRRK